MFRIFTLALALTLVGAAAPEDAGRFFLGSWSCAGVSWTYAELQPGSTWMHNVYGDPKQPGGTAVIGYVKGMHAWLYRDFHADGSYADLTSAGPKNGRWEWSGPYYPAAGGPALNGRITYVEVSATQYDRIFEALKDGKLVKMGGDTCRKS